VLTCRCCCLCSQPSRRLDEGAWLNGAPGTPSQRASDHKEFTLILLTMPIMHTQPLQAPDEVVWLNGAPGAGKGANTPFIMESRGISRAITM